MFVDFVARIAAIWCCWNNSEFVLQGLVKSDLTRPDATVIFNFQD